MKFTAAFFLVKNFAKLDKKWEPPLHVNHLDLVCRIFDMVSPLKAHGLCVHSPLRKCYFFAWKRDIYSRERGMDLTLMVGQQKEELSR
ncbi:hypothetical protein VIGAN_01200100 [Vigna angularis var. angularis]|nr:hypothetical protein VIGAN_01200100 [Vigna angularis var. angularis]